MTRCTHNANYVCPECEQLRASTPTEKEAGDLSDNAKLLLEGTLFSRGWTHRADHEADDERVRLIGFEIPEAAMPVNQTLDALREIKAVAISRTRSASVTDAADPLADFVARTSSMSAKDLRRLGNIAFKAADEKHHAEIGCPRPEPTDG